MATVLATAVWHSPLLHSVEGFTLTRDVAGGWELSGVAAVGGEPGHIEYRVETDDRWVTHLAEIDVRTDAQSRHLELGLSDSGWTLNGSPRPDLRGCLDIDLGWTPATNLLPIRRLGLADGESETIHAAWVRFPEFTVERSEQTYTRVSRHLWRYRSGPYDFPLDIGPHGLVERYGDQESGLWRRLPTS